MSRAYRKSVPPVLKLPSCWDEAVGYMERRQSGRVPMKDREALRLGRDAGPGPVRRVNRWARDAADYLKRRWTPVDCGPAYLRDLRTKLKSWGGYFIGHPPTVAVIRDDALPAIDQNLRALKHKDRTMAKGKPCSVCGWIHDPSCTSFIHPVTRNEYGFTSTQAKAVSQLHVAMASHRGCEERGKICVSKNTDLYDSLKKSSTGEAAWQSLFSDSWRLPGVGKGFIKIKPPI